MNENEDTQTENVETVHVGGCRRKVRLGRKIKLCRVMPFGPGCGYCSNHCQDSRCDLHGEARR